MALALNLGIGGHEQPNRGLTDDYLTPPEILDDLGPFDVDPCASTDQPWRTATVEYTEADNGLWRLWVGFAWVNPPYSALPHWLGAAAGHGNGLVLTFARTDTATWKREVWRRADAVMFLTGRLTFRLPVTGAPASGNAGAPSALIAYGPEAVERLRKSRLGGAFIENWAAKG